MLCYTVTFWVILRWNQEVLEFHMRKAPTVFRAFSAFFLSLMLLRYYYGLLTMLRSFLLANFLKPSSVPTQCPSSPPASLVYCNRKETCMNFPSWPTFLQSFFTNEEHKHLRNYKNDTTTTEWRPRWLAIRAILRKNECSRQGWERCNVEWERVKKTWIMISLIVQ